MIDIRNITCGYGNCDVLKDLSASFEKGRLTSVIGPNGCGKSTLLKSAVGILPIRSGNITLDGISAASMAQNEIAKRISYLPQGRTPPDMTVWETVLHGRFPYLTYPRRYSQRDREIAREAMARMEIEELSDYQTASLSGGMRQIVYIAMALTQDTDYILLDEPNTYLDISHQLKLMKTLRSLADGGKGIVTVMHDLPMAMTFSDVILAMRSGEVLSSSTPAELFSSNLTDGLFGISMQYENGEYSYRLRP